MSIAFPADASDFLLGFQHQLPDEDGFFGVYGGQFVPDSLKERLRELAEAFDKFRDNSFFKDELLYYFTHYTGRPNPVFFCANLSARLGGARIYLKREDLNHLGAHKINNTLGQGLLAKRMGKKRIIAETGAGQHGVAAAASGSVAGTGMHRVYGGRGHAAPAAQRDPHADARCDGNRRNQRSADAQGSCRRGVDRVGR